MAGPKHTIELPTPEVRLAEGESGPILRVTDDPYVIELELVDGQIGDLLYEILRYRDTDSNQEVDD